MRIYRRIHSLCGLLFGLFLALHLLIVTTAMTPARFNQNSAALHMLSQNMPLAESVGIGLPVLILALCGFYLLARAGLRYDVRKCKRGGKFRYFLQRASAIIVALFLIFHLSTFGRWALWPVFDPQRPFDSTLAGVRTFWSSLSPSNLLNLGVLGFYLLGILAVVYHFANGLWTAAAAWSLMTSPEAERNWGWTCAAIGVVLGCVGIGAWIAFLHP